MSSNASVSIITPRVRRAQRELIDALSESVSMVDSASIEETEGRLSAIIADIWNEIELRTRGRIPGERRAYGSARET